MAAYRSSSENKRKMNLIPLLNKTLPRAHVELVLDVLGIPRKLVKYVIHLFLKKLKKKIKKIFVQAAQTTIDQFLVSRNFTG
jgi:hypothetical protein